MSFITAIRAGICPALAPKLMRAFPSRAVYHSPTGETPISKFESRRYAVHCLVAIVLRRLTVRVQVNESGCDGKPGRIDLGLAAQRTCGDGGDLLAVDSDITHGIQARFRVQHPTVLHNDVIGLSCQECRQEQY